MELQQLEKRIDALENENKALKKEYGLTAKHPFSFYKEKRREEFRRFIDKLSGRGVMKYIDRETLVKRIEMRLNLKHGTLWGEMVANLTSYVETATNGIRETYRKELFPGGSIGMKQDEIIAWEVQNFSTSQRAGRQDQGNETSAFVRHNRSIATSSVLAEWDRIFFELLAENRPKLNQQFTPIVAEYIEKTYGKARYDSDENFTGWGDPLKLKIRKDSHIVKVSALSPYDRKASIKR